MISPRSCLFALAVLALAAPRAEAQSPTSDDVARLFSHEAPVHQEYGGSYRLPLSPEVLAVCRADLSDVRLYDAYGTEIPWMVDSVTRLRSPGDEVAMRVAVHTLAATHSVEGPPRTPPTFHEAFDVPAPPESPARSSWELVLDSTTPSFVADVRVVRVEPDRSETELARGTVFRFAGPVRERLRVRVPSASGAGPIHVELTGHDAYLEPSFAWEATREARAADAMTIPLEIRSSARVGSETVLVVARPEGVTPDTLRFATTTPALLRAVRVEDEREATDGTLWRVPNVPGAEGLDVRVRALHGPTFTVRVDDQDSPALEGLTVSAVLAQPALVYFSQAATLRFGGGRVRAPRYDLASLQGSWAVDRLLDGSDAPSEASLGPIAESPGWSREPALAPLQRAGLAVPPGDHAFTAPLEVTAAQEGASRFVLDAPALAALREDLADLRVVDTSGAQWPYLLRDAPPLVLDVAPAPSTPEPGGSSYVIALPVPRASLSELRVDPDAALVSREARVIGIDERGDEVVLGSTTLVREPTGDGAPITIGLSPTRVVSLALVVNDGSERPLTFRAMQIVLPTREVDLVAPVGSYRLLAGDDDAQAPTYEIERVRGLLDTIPLDDATLGAIAPNPAHHTPSFFERAGASTIALYGVLVLAILVLGTLTWRASREPGAPSSSSSSSPSPSPSSSPSSSSSPSPSPSTSPSDGSSTPSDAPSDAPPKSDPPPPSDPS